MFKPEDKHKNLPSWEHVKNKKMTAKQIMLFKF